MLWFVVRTCRTPMLGVLKDPPCVWLVCVGMCNKESPKISQGDVSQQFLKVWAVFVPSEPWVLSLLLWCAWPRWTVRDSGANPEAVPCLSSTGAARDLAPQACCRMGSLWHPLASSSSGRRRLQDCPGFWEGEWYLTPQVIGVGMLPVLHCLAVPLSGFPLLRNHHHPGGNGEVLQHLEPSPSL